MPRTTKSSRKPAAGQVDRFRKVARELETDEDEAAFEDKLKRLAKAKPKEKTPDK